MPASRRSYSNEFDNDDYRPAEEIPADEINLQSYRQKQKSGFLIDRKIKSGPATRFVGVEIEVAGGKADPTPWISEVRRVGHGVVSDGSIRTSPAARAWDPVEITTIPANGRKFQEVMRNLNDALKASKARTNQSCGTHVHVDARDLGWSGIRTLIEVWRMVEAAMFQAVPASRRGDNHYCQPCGERYWDALNSPDQGRFLGYSPTGAARYAPVEPIPFKRKILSSLYGINTQGVPGIQLGRAIKQNMSKYNGARYAALNLHSWLYRGTVEFRLGGGTVHLTRTTYPWARVCRAIVHFAATCNTEDLEIMRAAYQGIHGPRRALEALLCRVGEGRLCEWYSERVDEVSGGDGE